MANEWLENDDVVFIVASGLPKNPSGPLRTLLQEKWEETELLVMDDELSEWALAKVRGKKRHKSKRGPASRALWRAFRALAAATYHLRGDEDTVEELKELRDRVETLWMDASPLFQDDEEEDDD